MFFGAIVQKCEPIFLKFAYSLNESMVGIGGNHVILCLHDKRSFSAFLFMIRQNENKKAIADTKVSARQQCVYEGP